MNTFSTESLHPIFANTPETRGYDYRKDENDLAVAESKLITPEIISGEQAPTPIVPESDEVRRYARTVKDLSKKEREKAVHLAASAAWMYYRHAPEIHYTQGPKRWQWHHKHYDQAWKGEFPRYADCSALATCVLYQGLHHFHIPDVVNGEHWRGGYTGTQTDHGRRVNYRLHVGDLIFYGRPVVGHVAVYVGGGMVISHGSEGGPYLLRLHYRPDYNHARRYL